MSTPASDAAEGAGVSAADRESGPSLTAGTTCPVAIIGMACMFPGAEDLESYWANIRDGVDSITEVPDTHWRVGDYFDSDPSRPDHTYGRRGGFLGPVAFDPLEFGIAPRDIQATDTSQLLGLVVAKQALADAGYGPDGREFNRDRTSVILGVTGALELVIPLGARLGHPIWRRAPHAAGVDPTTADDVVRRIGESYVDWQENSFPGLLGNVVAGRIANRLDLHGTNCVVDAACASSLGAIHLAALELQSGAADLAISGGIDTFNDIFMYMCFSKTPALSPSGNARPFDASADGTVLGEGLGVVVLKRLTDAQRDGDRVYAVIRGIGCASDGRGEAIYSPSADGQARAIRRAYAAANVSPATIGLLEAHGTGTKVGDATEIAGLRQVYDRSTDERSDTSSCVIGSVKANIGHTKAAAGAAGLIKAALALHRQVLPPSIKVDQPSPALAGAPLQINCDKRPWLAPNGHPRRAAVSAFGFGGSNYHCLLEAPQDETSAVDWDGRVQILAFSAPDPASLASQLPQVQPYSWGSVRALGAETRGRFDSTQPYRLLLVLAQDGAALERKLEAAHELLSSSPTIARTNDDADLVYGHGAPGGKLAALFPGQGAQRPGMLRDLACTFPEFRGAMARADRIFSQSGSTLSAHIYPAGSFSEQDRAANEAALRATQIAQPALGAVSLAALGVLERFAVRFDAAIGHSYGELVALCAAGRLTPTTYSVCPPSRRADGGSAT